MNRHLLTGAMLVVLALAGCRGVESDNEPIHPILNMDFQEKYQAQEANDLFADGRAMRPPVPGTVARGFLREDERFYTGRTESGSYVEKAPVPVTQALLRRGRERFNIYCAVCHGQSGDGQGIIMTGNYGYTPSPTYHKTALRDTADGYLYDVITNGVRNMPGYAQQVPVADRWAIVTYIRALQRSQNARRENVPPSVLARIEQTGSANMNAARNPSSGSEAGSSTDTTSGSTPASADTAAADTATTSSTSADTTQTAAATAAPDTATAADTAAVDTASAGPAPADTTATADAGSADTSGAGTAANTSATEDAETSTTTGEESGGGFFDSTFLILVLVVVPIAVLMAILLIAFRKDREH